MTIRIGVGGWTYEPWRGEFFPKDLPQKRELEYASRRLNSIEINGTYYGSQKPESFQRWHDETPEQFVFSVKGPRFATNRRVLAEAGESIERFFASGVTRLGPKLGPVNWQFTQWKKFEAEDFAAFIALLPREVDGLPIRHVLEVRHESFRSPEFVALAREKQIAVVIAGDSEYPQIPDLTAPFAYLRIMGTEEGVAHGYAPEALKTWAARVREWAAGNLPADIEGVGGDPAAPGERDVFVYLISGFKTLNPAAAIALMHELGIHWAPPALSPAASAKPRAKAKSPAKLKPAAVAGVAEPAAVPAPKPKKTAKK